MSEYIVSIREVHISHRKVKANSEEEAIAKAEEEGQEIFCEFSHNINPDMWTVEKISKVENSSKV